MQYFHRVPIARLLLFVPVTAMALVSCYSANQLQTPGTVPKKTFRGGVGLSWVSVPRTGVPGKSSESSIPILQTGLRYGVSEQVDTGLRLDWMVIPFAGVADVKWKFFHSPKVDLAIDPAIYVGDLDEFDSNDESELNNYSMTTVALQLPFIVGLRLHDRIGLMLSPAIHTGYGWHGETSTHRTVDRVWVAVGGNVAPIFRVASGVWLMAEAGLLYGLQGESGDSDENNFPLGQNSIRVHGSIGILFGLGRGISGVW